MAEKIEPVVALIWDRRTISIVRRELEKGFEALKKAYENANKNGTKGAHEEATRIANQFYDLYDARCLEYQNATIEPSDSAKPPTA